MVVYVKKGTILAITYKNFQMMGKIDPHIFLYLITRLIFKLHELLKIVNHYMYMNAPFPKQNSELLQRTTVLLFYLDSHKCASSKKYMHRETIFYIHDA